MLTVLIYRILFSKYFYAHFKTRTNFQTTSEENYTFSTEWNHITYIIPIFYLLFCIGYVIFLHFVLCLWIPALRTHEKYPVNTLNTLHETQLSLLNDCIYRPCHNKVLDVIEAISRYFNHWQNSVTWQEKFGPEDFNGLKGRLLSDVISFGWDWFQLICFCNAYLASAAVSIRFSA